MITYTLTYSFTGFQAIQNGSVTFDSLDPQLAALTAAIERAQR
jgi:hypothetical protein